MAKYWFKRKTYGWGWTPSTWEGWFITIMYIMAALYIFRKIDSTSHSASDTLIGFTYPLILLTFILIIVCYFKGEEPRWQWGKNRTKKRT
jgi:hypothetical protein